MKTKTLFLVLFLFCAVYSFPKEESWGNLKKIYFYDSIKAYDQVLKHLEMIDLDGLNRGDKKELATRLIAFGDYYFEAGNYDSAERFYRKVLDVSSEYWPLYNKMEKIGSAKGGFFIGFKSIFNQLFMVLENFRSSFMMVNQFFNILFFSALFVFFLFAGFILIKNFRLAATDLLIDETGKIPTKKILIFFAILLWPVFMLSGWMIYPFLAAGLFWSYMNDSEKNAIKFMMVIIVVVTVLYGFNRMAENNVRVEKFQKAWNVYEGKLYNKEECRLFDDDLKTVLAYFYYENGDFNNALDIINTTGESFKSKVKYILLGNINYRFGDFSQGSEYYLEALKLDDRDPIALNNFTMAQLKINNPEALKSYAQRFPEIDGYRNQVLNIKEIKIKQSDLWKRSINATGSDFSFGEFFSGLAGEFLRLPVVYYMLLFIAYVLALKKVIPSLGESSYCGKCAKIIKDASMHKSYKLCDDCHQLFSIKDVIFLEAKILKEKELRKKVRKKYIWSTMFSIIIPGLNFNHKENNWLFLVSSTVFYTLIGFAVVGAVNFKQIFSISPLFLNLVGAVAIVFYFLVNIISVMGEDDGI